MTVMFRVQGKAESSLVKACSVILTLLEHLVLKSLMAMQMNYRVILIATDHSVLRLESLLNNLPLKESKNQGIKYGFKKYKLFRTSNK
jgi:hypothetical protein